MFGFTRKPTSDDNMRSLQVIANYDSQVRIYAGDVRFMAPEPASIAALREELRKRGVLAGESSEAHPESIQTK